MENKEKDKIQDEFMEFWEKNDNVGLGKYSDDVADWWFSKIDLLLKSKQEEIERAMDEMRKNPKKDIVYCTSYELALDDLKPIITNILK